MATKTTVTSGNFNDTQLWGDGSPVNPSIIDNADGGYSETGGGWLTSAEGYAGSVRYRASGSGSNTASWTKTGLTAGTYSVGMYWTNHANRDSAVPYTIYDSDGTTVLASGTINQELAPSGFSYNGVTWQLLNAVTITGTSVKITITDNASEVVIADAVIVYQGLNAGTVPGDGDLVVISDGHTVDIAAGNTVTIGDGDPTHYAIRTAGTGGTGILNITGGTLNLKASVLQGNATWSITGTPTINYTDNSDGTWTIGDAHNQTSARLVMTGTSNGSRITVASTSTGKLSFTTASLQGGLIRAQYVNFSGITGSGGYGFLSWPSNNANQEWFLNCSFDACSHFEHVNGNMAAGAVCRIERTYWTNTVSDQCIGAVLAADNAISGGTRTLIGNGFDKGGGTIASAGQWRDFTSYRNYWGGRLLQFNAATRFASIDQNFIVSPGGSITLNWHTPTLATERNYIYFKSDAGQISNLHALTPFADMRGFILEPDDTDTTGDIFMLDGTNSTYEIAYNLMLPNAGGSHAGQFVSALGALGLSLSVHHNTFVTSAALIETGSISYGEGTVGAYNGHANMFSEIHSNSVWSPNGTGYLFTRRITRTVSDGCAAANIRNNGVYNCSAGNLGFPGIADEGTDGTFAPMFSTGTPNAGGTTENPRYFDPSRRLADWAAARGYADGREALHTDPYNRIPDLIDYVAAGWRVTNPTYETGGRDGDTIGSEVYVAASTGRRGMNNRLLRPY